MDRLKKLADRYIYSDDLPLEARNINIICPVGFCAAFFLLLLRLYEGAPPLVITMTVVTLLLIPALAWLGNRFGLYRLCTWLFIIFMCYFVFPSGFFFFGGINGPSIAYFVLSSVTIFMLKRGVWLVLAILIHLVLVVLCFLVGDWYPEMVLALAPEVRLLDFICSFIVAGVTLGTMVYLQQDLLSKERSKLLVSGAELEAEREQATLLIDASPTATLVFDKNLQLVTCNNEAVAMFGFSNREILLQNFSQELAKAIPPIQPNGRASIPLSERLLTVSREGVARFDTTLLIGGQTLSLDAVFKKIPDGDSYRIIAYFHNVSDLVHTRLELQYHDRLLGVTNEVATLLLSQDSSNLDKTMETVMSMLTTAYEVEHMCVWRRIVEGGTELVTPVYEWPIGEAGTGAGCAPIAAQGWQQESRDGRLTLPIFLHKELWGSISLDAHRKDRVFSEDELNILQSVALMMANAINRTQAELVLANRLEQQELMAAISHSFVAGSANDTGMDGLIENALRQVGEFLRVSRVLVVISDKETGESHPTYSWVASKTWTPEQTQTDFYTFIQGVFSPKLLVGNKVATVSCDNTEAGEDGRYRTFFEQARLKSFIGAPIYVEGDYWGMLSIEECEHFRAWSESDKQLVGSVNSAIAGAIARDLIDCQRADALQKAITASKAKGDFLSNMSHEMRTPMNAIIGMTSIGKAAPDSERKDYAFGKIEEASTHLLGVINDILDMSKIEANKLELSSVDFNFEKMLQKVANVMNFKIEEHHQTFYVCIDRRIPTNLIGDDQRLAQVITNLLSNANKFTPEGGNIRLDATYVEYEEDGYVNLRIQVTDSGIGISADQQKRLFDSFQQAESGTSRQYGGTGLGLAISKQIIELMGGSIWIESELGQGASFIFTVRMRVGTGARHTQLAEGVDWKNLRLLAVDDDEYVLLFFRNLAEQYKVTCDLAANGDEALALIEGYGPYDVYFIDWRMPGMDGIELTRRIKATGEHTSVVTIISSSEWDEIEKDAKGVGVDHYLTKPLFPSTIVDLINELIGIDQVVEVAPTLEEADDFSPYTVLLAEDVEINREIVLALLEPTGLTIDAAGDGREAVKMFESAPERYDIIFMDVQMPHMDGLEATRRIRELDIPRARTIPIVAMTANVFREDIDQCLGVGMDAHVGKPIDLPEVLSILRRYLPDPPRPTPRA
jgi:signal transduction histidine kinase/DNA-binding response OmpR family regulator/PAS domain-containing protein